MQRWSVIAASKRTGLKLEEFYAMFSFFLLDANARIVEDVSGAPA
jgi:hypothetical protein